MLDISRHSASHLRWVMVLLIALLTSCQQTVENASTATVITPPPTALRATIQPALPASITPTEHNEAESPALRWLTGIPCSAPCWEQLTPGTTTITDAKDRLSQLVSITDLQDSAGRNNDPSLLSWQWKGHPNGGSIFYYSKKPAFTDPPLNTIMNISLALDQTVAFQDIITHYGEPSHIQLVADYNSTLGMVYYFSVVYLDKGFLLQSKTNDFSQKPTLDSDTTFHYVVMFEPSTQGFDVAIEPFFPLRQPSQFLVPWGGMDTDINTYCREMRPDTPEKGCS